MLPLWPQRAGFRSARNPHGLTDSSLRRRAGSGSARTRLRTAGPCPRLHRLVQPCGCVWGLARGWCAHGLTGRRASTPSTGSSRAMSSAPRGPVPETPGTAHSEQEAPRNTGPRRLSHTGPATPAQPRRPCHTGPATPAQPRSSSGGSATKPDASVLGYELPCGESDVGAPCLLQAPAGRGGPGRERGW